MTLREKIERHNPDAVFLSQYGGLAEEGRSVPEHEEERWKTSR
jgi:hypothetical protein